MNHYDKYWTVTIIRGLLAMLFGLAVLVVPQMSHSLLLLPFAVLFSILFLGVYGATDSAILFCNSFAIPARQGRTASRLQGMLGLIFAVLLVTLALDRVRLEWFFYLVAAQAISAGTADFITARHLSRSHGTRWVYLAAAISFAAGAIYLGFAIIRASNLSIAFISSLIFGYLLLFGAAETILAWLMLRTSLAAQQHVMPRHQ